MKEEGGKGCVVLSARDDWPSNPVDVLIAETGVADAKRDVWPRTTQAEVGLWKHNGFDFWEEVLPAVLAHVQSGRPPPRSWKYFTDAIRQAHSDRMPPPRTANERTYQSNGNNANGRSGRAWIDAIAEFEQKRDQSARSNGQV